MKKTFLVVISYTHLYVLPSKERYNNAILVYLLMYINNLRILDQCSLSIPSKNDRKSLMFSAGTRAETLV